MNAHEAAEPQIERAAHILASLRREGRQLVAPDVAWRPTSLAQAYQVQDRVRALLGWQVTGWKVGATARPVQEKFGITEPFVAPFYAPTTMASPARADTIAFPHRIIECEFAFRFGAPLPPGGSEPTAEAIRSAVDALVPAIEIVGTRFSTLLFDDVATAIADGGLNAGFVLGEPATGWQGIDIDAHTVSLTVDGRTVAEGQGRNVLGGPWAILTWTVAHLHARGIGIARGDIISTGTTTGITVLQPGQMARADYGVLGSVEIAMTA